MHRKRRGFVTRKDIRPKSIYGLVVCFLTEFAWTIAKIFQHGNSLWPFSGGDPWPFKWLLVTSNWGIKRSRLESPVKRRFPSVTFAKSWSELSFFEFSWQKTIGRSLCYRFESDEHADHLAKMLENLRTKTFFGEGIGQLARNIWQKIMEKKEKKLNLGGEVFLMQLPCYFHMHQPLYQKGVYPFTARLICMLYPFNDQDPYGMDYITFRVFIRHFKARLHFFVESSLEEFKKNSTSKLWKLWKEMNMQTVKPKIVTWTNCKI